MNSPRFPEWLRRPLAYGAGIAATHGVLDDLGLATVCHGAKCPNISECFAKRTATFMILGTVCTRRCAFCNIGGAKENPKPKPVEVDEPERIATASRRMKLRHVVITSVTRDDLPDGGASHFAHGIELIRTNEISIEVLTPDFNGNENSIRAVAESGPDVYNHNIETVPRLYGAVRPGADYERSLSLIKLVKNEFPNIVTKSGMMVGCGETLEEVLAVMDDLRSSDCDVITIGQYLAPSEKHLPIHRFVVPEEFSEMKNAAKEKGFLGVACGPYVRSSYNAAYVFGKAGKTDTVDSTV
ncbi:MAG: lipoyl synthase [Planctomycetota bacterium]